MTDSMEDVRQGLIRRVEILYEQAIVHVSEKNLAALLKHLPMSPQTSLCVDRANDKTFRITMGRIPRDLYTLPPHQLGHCFDTVSREIDQMRFHAELILRVLGEHAP